jgi:hypothetical protein
VALSAWRGRKLDQINRTFRSAEAAVPLTPVEDYLAELHQHVSELTGGKVADYIPELS